jgi:hypothetical protein
MYLKHLLAPLNIEYTLWLFILYDKNLIWHFAFELGEFGVLIDVHVIYCN